MLLENFFKNCKSENKKIALAFSGGTDSTYLLYKGIKSGADITAYYVKTQFQPEFEFQDAKKLAKELNAKLCVIELDILKNPDVKENSPQRCYFCKKTILTEIKKQAKEDIFIEGTNASDDIQDRPGFQALKEFGILSPLRDAGLTKKDIRRLSKEAGLFTWNKPSYSCLATRIETGTPIEEKELSVTEKAEGELMKMGFSNFRIRNRKDYCIIQITENQIHELISKKNEIIQVLKKYYKNVLVDLEPRKEND